MDKRLFVQALAKLIFGFIMISLLLFIPAGSLSYWNGWLFIGILFVPMLIVGIILFIKNPDLLRKRLNSKEKEDEQKTLLIIGLLMFVCGFIAAGLNYNFKWLMLPRWITAIGAVIFLLSYIMYAEVLRENVYLSRTVEIQDNQKVIDTGLYSVVRHPMYTSTVLLFLSIPLVLGSPITFLIFLIYPFIIIRRILNEEQVLVQGLAGYSEYKKKVKYRLIPFIW